MRLKMSLGTTFSKLRVSSHLSRFSGLKRYSVLVFPLKFLRLIPFIPIFGTETGQVALPAKGTKRCLIPFIPIFGTETETKRDKPERGRLVSFHLSRFSGLKRDLEPGYLLPFRVCLIPFIPIFGTETKALHIKS